MKDSTFFRGVRGPVGSGKSVACCVEVFRRSLEQKKNDQAGERFKEVLVKYDDKEALNIAQKYLDQLDSN